MSQRSISEIWVTLYILLDILKFKDKDKKGHSESNQVTKNVTISSSFPPWLAHSKTLPIRQHISLIDRPELERLLYSGIDKKLSLLTAPAGFGKTTLLGQWRKKLQEDHVTVAWLKIDDDDNDPSIFSLYLAYSLIHAGLEEEIFSLHPTGFNTDISPRAILGVLLSAITRFGQKVVLIFDDVEKLDENAIVKTITPLLRYAPDNLHIILASRSSDNLHLSSLKMQGQVNQITPTELKFTPFEIEEFLGNKLSKKTLHNIGIKTEGWPVALQLIKNAIAGHNDIEKVVADFQGNEQDTRDYIFEQILKTLPSHQKDLLMDASILEHLDPDTIDYIRAENNSAHLLHELENLNQLINPIEDSENHYRLHPLFQEAMVYFLEKSNPERLKTLHLRAAEIFVQKGHVIQAIRHALRAKEPETAAEILEKAGGILLWNKEGMSRIRKAHALLPEEIIKTRPRLSLLRALVLLKDGHLNEARHIYETVQQNLKTSGQTPSSELEYDIAVITATLAVYEGSPLKEEMSNQLVASIEQFKNIDLTQTGFVYTILCVFNLQKGDFKAARDIGLQAISHFQKQRSIFGETYIYIHLGIVATAEGNLDEAYEYYKKVQTSQRRHFIDDKDMRLVLNILMAEWHYEKNELTTAARLLGDVNRRLETGEAWYEIYAAGYSTASAITYLQKGLGASLNLSDDSAVYIKRESLKRLNRLILANKVSYLCRAGKEGHARKLVQGNNLTTHNYTPDNGTYFSVRECYGVVQALVRLLIVEKRYKEAIQELNPLIKRHLHGLEAKALQKYRLLLSIAQFNNGEITSAMKELDSVLAFVRTRGFLRFILDEETLISPVLNAYISHAGVAEKDHAQYLLTQFDDIKLPNNNISLSRREKQVLNQLSEGFSDKMIARNLDVTENTVRFHLKNLFAKLDVNSRLMAVSEATKHKLL